MEISEAFDLLEKRIDEIGLIDAWGNPQDPAWGLALVEKFGGQDAEDLSTGLSMGLITPKDYYEQMSLIVDRFRVKHLADRFGARIEKQLRVVPRYRIVELDEDFDLATLDWENWWDAWWAQVEVWASKQPELDEEKLTEPFADRAAEIRPEGVTI